MTRQFTSGVIPRSLTGGLPFQVKNGDKHGFGDLVLEVWCPDGWRKVEMRAIGMAHAFFCENEDYIWPRPHYLGGDYFRAFEVLCEQDWLAASKKVARERAWADRKRRGVA